MYAILSLPPPAEDATLCRSLTAARACRAPAARRSEERKREKSCCWVSEARAVNACNASMVREEDEDKDAGLIVDSRTVTFASSRMERMRSLSTSAREAESSARTHETAGRCATHADSDRKASESENSPTLPTWGGRKRVGEENRGRMGGRERKERVGGVSCVISESEMKFGEGRRG